MPDIVLEEVFKYLSYKVGHRGSHGRSMKVEGGGDLNFYNIL